MKAPAIREARPADAAAGRTLLGAHRSDMAVSFEAKGEAGATYTLMAFATHLGQMPAQKTFEAGPEWKRAARSALSSSHSSR